MEIGFQTSNGQTNPKVFPLRPPVCFEIVAALVNSKGKKGETKQKGGLGNVMHPVDQHWRQESFKSIWEFRAMDQLLDYIKVCFLCLLNSINEMAYDVLKEQSSCSILYLKNAWAELCKTYLLEEKWYHNGYTPTFEEYMKHAWISVGGPLSLVHHIFSVTKTTTKEALECLEKHPAKIAGHAMIVRLSNDLVSSQ
ncbi:hypothetical protein RJ640_010655, partial [Escallonia rubra]